MGRVYLIVGAGAALLLLLTFQVLVGRRVIHFPGALHMRIHRWTGYGLLAAAFVHAAIAIGWVFGWY